MKVKMFSFLSAVMAMLFLVALCVPAFASSDSQYEQKTGFWDWITDQNSILPDFVGYMAGTICSKSEDGYHHANTYLYDKQNGYYKCLCTYCGKKFDAYESDLKQSYDNYVSEFPAQGITSAGNLLWQPCFDDIKSILYSAGNSYYSSFSYDANSSGNGFFYSYSGNGTVYSGCTFLISICSVPISGLYRRLDTCSFVLRCSSNGQLFSEETNYALGSWTHYSADTSLNISDYTGRTSRGYGPSYFLSFSVFFPFYEVVPDSVVDLSEGGQYSVTTRPTSITGGNYGIIGDDGTLNVVTNNNQIVNETNNTYYNPSTGQTSTITNWSYNYENRTYDITLDTGDKVSVKYGDQNIIIKEGDINYTIYYIVNGSGSTDPSPTPSGCAHDWQETSRKDPTCTLPGRVTSVCSVCGESKSEILPALDHDWEALYTVLTQYDEDGNLIQEGYIIYECARCGEQYKDGDNTGPPDAGIDDGGLLGFLNGIINYLSDHLFGAVDLLRRFFSEIPRLFGGFLGFLSAMFPYLPDDIVFLFTFGIAALVFIGVIKAIRR